VLRYEHLARNFTADQPFYAIESPGLRGFPPDHSVEVMARHYIEQIREQQPHGPYFVAGHSFGGLVTYEIARQLSAQNEEMGLVGLIDTFQRSLTGSDIPMPPPARSDKLPFSARLIKDIKALFLEPDRTAYLQERKMFMQARITKALYRALYRFTSRLDWRYPFFWAM
jgi:thioesterase domain-containing protein